MRGQITQVSVQLIVMKFCMMVHVYPRHVFSPFRKAFDSVNHNLLLRKLYSRNVPHCLIRWFISCLEKRMQRLHIGTNNSSWLLLNGAMPHGSWLQPLTFLLLIERVEKLLDI